MSYNEQERNLVSAIRIEIMEQLGRIELVNSPKTKPEHIALALIQASGISAALMGNESSVCNDYQWALNHFTQAFGSGLKSRGIDFQIDVVDARAPEGAHH